MKKSTIFFILLLCSFEAQAASEQDRILQRYQQFERDKVNQKDIKNTEEEQKKIEEEKPDIIFENKKGSVVQDFKDIQCFRINKINFSENKILPKIRATLIAKKYLGRCLNFDQIAAIKRKAADYLIKKGYSTSTVVIPEQTLTDGVLKIEIIENRLEKLTFNDEKFSDKTEKFFAFGFVEKNEPLNIAKIEQGLDQINRLASNNATVKISPGTTVGSSIAHVENHPKNRSKINLAYDNNGNKTTGENRETIGFSQDNLLHLNDNFTISKTSNFLDKYNKEKGTNSVSSSFSVPFSWYNLTLSYSRSLYHFHSLGDNPSKFYGDTTTKAVILDRLLIKNNNLKISSSASLSSRYSQNFQNDERLENQSRRSSILYFSLPTTLFLDKATLFLRPSYSKSIKILDAQKDPAEISSSNAHAQFDILKLYANYRKNLQVAQLPLSYNLIFDSQLSKQRLNGIDQFSVGGIYSVRGFKDGSISADSGYLLKNEVKFGVGRAILPYLNQDKLPKLSQYLNYFSLTPFYDYGYVRAKGGIEGGRLSGTGFRISFNNKNIEANLGFSWALSKSQLLLQNQRENSAVYFNINSDFSFF